MLHRHQATAIGDERPLNALEADDKVEVDGIKLVALEAVLRPDVVDVVVVLLVSLVLVLFVGARVSPVVGDVADKAGFDENGGRKDRVRSKPRLQSVRE